jgi:carbon storage regulator CsrA
MLVLSRKQQQTIVVDNQITITVLKVKGNTVRLGIQAPDDVPIRRSELSPLLMGADQKAKVA